MIYTIIRIIILFFGILTLYMFIKSKSETHIRMTKEIKLPVLNVLTRTSGRESCFKKLLKSFHEQDYVRKRHLVANDKGDAYVRGIPEVLQVIPVRDAGKCFYNLYLNDLWNQVKEGWLIFLDDDAFIFDKGFLKRLAKKCATLSPKTLLIMQSYYGTRKKVMPRKMEKGRIDMVNICVHHSCPYRFDGNCGGDWRLIEQILNDPSYKVVHMNIPGTWANYMGKANGKSVECK